MAQFQTFYYEEGNAVRRYESPALPTREDLAREQYENRQRRKQARLRAHRKAKRINRRNTVMLLGGIFLMGAFFVTYVHIQNRITTSMSHISRLEKEISDIKTENAAAKSRISTTANLDAISRTAVKELGMVYANSDQIVYYTIDDEDYMSQLEKID